MIVATVAAEISSSDDCTVERPSVAWAAKASAHA
jgi:hypothetical protein